MLVTVGVNTANVVCSSHVIPGLNPISPALYSSSNFHSNATPCLAPSTVPVVVCSRRQTQ